ncbi:hypothetical protein [Pontibacter sp. SGAir0037]|uniref:hypothetical protein n=1 Tax=Pontibacter sp. SGAir0037 TaxID=2571030 RepID=UPI0010CCD558|nr:hypothetical protein [Pontibacter sp. SGAir0037]QCR22486.1 hypothetical protein C1N53_09160 [Pontibacter sp. SGAir0037]
MKRILLLLIAFLAIRFSSHACDGSCTMGGSYFGILPQFHRNFAGLRYSTRSYTISTTHTHMHEGMPMTHPDVIEQRYSTLEAWGRFVPFKNVQVFAFVPYALNEQSTTRGLTTYKGLGDITILANYALLNTGDSLSHAVKHTLQVGGGIKVATGIRPDRQQEGEQTETLSPGTGSTNYLLNGIYTIRVGKFGLNSDLTYRMNNANSSGYRFGNRLSTSSNLFYWYTVEDVTLLPSAGVYYEHAKADEFGTNHMVQQGGDAYFSNLGLNIYIRNMAVGGTLQLPISSTDNHHVTKSNARTMVNLNYMF